MHASSPGFFNCQSLRSPKKLVHLLYLILLPARMPFSPSIWQLQTSWSSCVLSITWPLPLRYSIACFRQPCAPFFGCCSSTACKVNELSVGEGAVMAALPASARDVGAKGKNRNDSKRSGRYSLIICVCEVEGRRFVSSRMHCLRRVSRCQVCSISFSYRRLFPAKPELNQMSCSLEHRQSRHPKHLAAKTRKMSNLTLAHHNPEL